MCFAEQTSKYSKAYKLDEQSTKDGTASATTDNDGLELMVGEDHPGHGYAYMRENTHFKIPLVSIPEGHMCQIKDLEIGSGEVNVEVENNREWYAKIELILFHPFCCLQDPQTNASYWNTFDVCRTNHFAGTTEETSDNSHHVSTWNPSATSIWEKGFEILKNIDNQKTVSKSNVRTGDRLTSKTRYEEEEDQNDTNNNEMNEEDNIQDILFFCNKDKEDQEDSNSDIEKSDWNYSHTSLINQSNANNSRLVEAR